MPQIFSQNRYKINDTALHDHLAASLLDRLSDIKRKGFEKALWIGAVPPSDARFMYQPFCVEGEIERFLHEAASLDLIICCGELHRVNDLPGVLIQMRRALKPDGLFLCALIGGETLHELRDSLTRVELDVFGAAAPRIHPMIDLQSFAALMQRAGFALPAVDSGIEVIYYNKINKLYKDIKVSGEGLLLASRPRQYLGKGFWPRVEADYKKHHTAPDGLFKASIEIIHGIGWGPADTQQKPLKPGSAEHRLADALGAVEKVIDTQ